MTTLLTRIAQELADRGALAALQQTMREHREEAATRMAQARAIADRPGFPGSVTETERRLVVSMATHLQAVSTNGRQRHLKPKAFTALLARSDPDTRRVLLAAKEITAYRMNKRQGLPRV